jgi:hypothetical protein
MGVTEMTNVETDREAARQAYAALAEPRDECSFNTELIAAGDFVAEHGLLLDSFDGDEMDAIRGPAWPAHHSATAMLSHWSAEADWVAAGDDRVDTKLADAIFQEHARTCNVCSYLEAVHNLAAWLNSDANGCGQCGQGARGHEFGPALSDGSEPFWGHVLNSCLEPWQRAEPAALDFRDLYAFQVGEGYSAIWYAPLTDGTYAVVARTWYVVEDGGDDDRTLVREDSYLICTDPAKPWDSKVAQVSFDEDLDDDPDSYDLLAMAEQCEGPGRGEWANNVKPYATPGRAAGDVVPEFVWG